MNFKLRPMCIPFLHQVAVMKLMQQRVLRYICRTCMICNESCEKPTFLFHNNLSIEDRNNINTYNYNLNHYDDTPLIINTRSRIDQLYENYTNYIVNRLDNLPFDNENELKTICFAGLFYCVIYIIYIIYT